MYMVINFFTQKKLEKKGLNQIVQPLLIQYNIL